MQATDFVGTFDQLFVSIFYEIFTENASLFLLYHGEKESKMTKNSNQGVSTHCELTVREGCYMYSLRGGWRNLCFPAPFSWFLHKTDLKDMKKLLHAVFHWNVKGKTRKKRKNTAAASFVASLGAWRHSSRRRPAMPAIHSSDVKKRPSTSWWLSFSGLGPHLESTVDLICFTQNFVWFYKIVW